MIRLSSKSLLFPTTHIGINGWLSLLSGLFSSRINSLSLRTSSKDSVSSTENTRMKASADLMASCLIAGNSYEPLVSSMSSVRRPERQRAENVYLNNGSNQLTSNERLRDRERD